jgi:multidrug efflux pump subunit AcrB
VAVLAVAPAAAARPGAVSAAVRDELARLRPGLLQGLQADVLFDFAPNREAAEGAKPPRYLRMDVVLPNAASAERTLEVLRRCERLVRTGAKVTDALAVCGRPGLLQPNEGYLLVRLADADDFARVTRDLRARLTAEIRDGPVWLSDPSAADGVPATFPVIELAVYGTVATDAAEAQEAADRFGQELRCSGKFTDVRVSQEGSGTRQLLVDIDREKLKSMGVSSSELFDTLQASLESYYLNDFNRSGRTWQVVIQCDAPFRTTPESIRRLPVRTTKGEVVPLERVATVRVVDNPAVLSLFNGLPMVPVTAELAPGVSPEEARALCETRAGKTLPPGYGLGWLQGP